MIIEGLTGLAAWLIGLLFEGLQTVTLPFNLINVLLDFMKFGVWVLGGDLYLIVMSTIIGWLFFKISSGIILFIYRLIPLT